METPAWALWLAYWLHMLATVIWIGGLSALAIFVLPAAQKALDAPALAAFISDLQHRLDPWGWFSLALLAGTGMIQMSASPHYQGLLAIDSPWATAILVKHLLFLGMASISAYLTWGIMPRLRRVLLRQLRQRHDHSDSEVEFESLQQQEVRLLRLNLTLGVLVLALTALARAA